MEQSKLLRAELEYYQRQELISTPVEDLMDEDIYLEWADFTLSVKSTLQKLVFEQIYYPSELTKTKAGLTQEINYREQEGECRLLRKEPSK